MKASVIVFPGSNCDHDAFWVLESVLGAKTNFIWHDDFVSNLDTDFIVLPGGFSYGDALRTGAIARFAHAMDAVREHAEKGKPVLGICNGFQILLEAGLLPGAMLPNKNIRFICDNVYLMPQNTDSVFTNAINEPKPLKIPIAHFEGNYFTTKEEYETLENNGQVLFRYCDANGNVTDDANPNGSIGNIAGIVNKKGNVLGMMPHPERASEKVLGSDDGLCIFESVKNHLGL